MRHALGRAGALAAVLLAILAAPTPAAALSLWSVTGSPLTITAGTETEVRLTVANLGGLPLYAIGCVTVLVPASTLVGDLSVSSVSGSWAASTAAAPGGTLITYQAPSSGDRLTLLESGSFRADVTPPAAGAQIWQVDAYDAIACDAGAFPPMIVEITVLPGLATPTPAPTSTPGPTASPRPPPSPGPTPATTPRPTPTSPASTAAPPAGTPGPGSSPTPNPGSIPTVTATAEPSPTTSTRPDGQTGRAAPGSGGGTSESGSGGGGGAGPAAEDWLAVPDGATVGLPDGLEVGTTSLGGLGVLLWAVPAAVLGIPGFLIIVVVLLQAGGGLIWLPIARRRIGGFGRQRGR